MSRANFGVGVKFENARAIRAGALMGMGIQLDINLWMAAAIACTIARRCEGGNDLDVLIRHGLSLCLISCPVRACTIRLSS